MSEFWSESKMGPWIDRKVSEIGFSHTAVLVGSWAQHDANLKDITERGLSLYWFAQASNEYAWDITPMYFVEADDRQDGDKILKAFSEIDNLVYARFYKGENSIKALSKEPSES